MDAGSTNTAPGRTFLSRLRWRELCFIAGATVILLTSAVGRVCHAAEPADDGTRLAGSTGTFAGIVFAWIPAGTFEMGSKLSADNAKMIFGGRAKDSQDELPRHGVELTRGFWLSTCEVTNSAFEQFAGVTGYETQAEREGRGRTYDGDKWEDQEAVSWREPGWDIVPDQPVVLVSWNDAQAHVDWLNTLGEGRFRLPTEAEWEYACRAGGIGLYGFGDFASALPEHGWYRANRLERGHFYPAQVATRPPNAWGLHDMHGNVGEWCQDWYDAAYYSYCLGTDPQGPEVGTHRILRGGSWSSHDRFCRSAARTCALPERRYVVVGYRLCRDE